LTKHKTRQVFEQKIKHFVLKIVVVLSVKLV